MGENRFILVVIEDKTAEMKQILLKQKNEEELERRVQRRTAELVKANNLMRMEIVQRKRAETKLRLAAKIVESTTDAIFVTDVQGKIIEVNGAFTRLSGYEREEVVGRDFAFSAAGQHGLDYHLHIWQTVMDMGEWQGEVWDRRKNGQSYCKMLSVSAVKNDRGGISHCVGIFCDITKRKQDEERLHRMAHFDALTDLPDRVLFS